MTASLFFLICAIVLIVAAGFAFAGIFTLLGTGNMPAGFAWAAWAGGALLCSRASAK